MCEQENYYIIEHYQILVHEMCTSRRCTRILKTRRLRLAGRAAGDRTSRHEMCASYAQASTAASIVLVT